MAWTQDDLDSIRGAIRTGVKRVTFADGRDVIYQDTAQMVAAELVIRTQLDLAARAASGIVRTRFATFGSGL